MELNVMISPKRIRLTLSTTLYGGYDVIYRNDNNNSKNNACNKKQEQMQQEQSQHTLRAVVSHSFVLSLILLILFVTVAVVDAQVHYQQQVSIVTTEIDTKNLTRLKSIDDNTSQHKDTTKKRTTKSMKCNVSSSNAIQDYLNIIMPNARKHIAIFKWNPDGTLSNNIIFPIVPKGDSIPKWFEVYYSEYNKVHNSFNTTSKSLHGKIAMMYGWDVLSYVLHKPQRIQCMDPPIPMLVYTIPKRFTAQKEQEQEQGQGQQQNIEQLMVRQNDDGTNETITWTTTPHLPNLQNNINGTGYVGTTIITNNIVHIPNPYDYGGFSQHRVDTVLQNNTLLFNISYGTFHQRSNVLLWRGSDHNEVARNHLVQLSQNQQNDVKDNNNNSNNNNSSNKIWLDAKFTSKKSNKTKMVEYVEVTDLVLQSKYHLDVGGCSGTSWEGIRWKLCTGNTVFIVDTSMIEWWFQYLIPYTHYIPIKEDLSNLYEQYTWVENNPIQAYNIAKAGQEICLQTYTNANAMEYTKPIIEQLPDATIQQIEEYDLIFFQHKQQQQQQNQE